MLLTDEESKREEDKSYKLWEKQSGSNLGVIRRELVAKAQLKKDIDYVVAYGAHAFIEAYKQSLLKEVEPSKPRDTSW